MTTTPDIISNAELINQFSAKIAEGQQVDTTTQAPPDTLVTLSGGSVDSAGPIKTAEVRELNGADEEAIAKASSQGTALNIALQRGLVNLGDRAATSSDLDDLLAGDRDAILLGIRIATFGKDVRVTATCHSCVKPTAVSIDLTTDIPVHKFDGERYWSVDTKIGAVTVGLPNGVVQKRLMENADKTSAELGTILLSGCITQLDNAPVVSSRIALNLGIADREKILIDITNRSPGPRLVEVTKTCETCGSVVPTPLSLADLFRL